MPTFCNTNTSKLRSPIPVYKEEKPKKEYVEQDNEVKDEFREYETFFGNSYEIVSHEGVPKEMTEIKRKISEVELKEEAKK